MRPSSGYSASPALQATLPSRAVGELVTLAADRGHDALGDQTAAAAQVGVGHQDHELVATVAGHDVVGAHREPETCRDVAQHPVAIGVAVDIVDGLEAVEVDHQHAQR